MVFLYLRVKYHAILNISLAPATEQAVWVGRDGASESSPSAYIESCRFDRSL